MDFSFLASYALILVALLYSQHEKLGLERLIFVNSIVAFAQLAAMGFVLVLILKLTNIVAIVAIVTLMICYASFLANRRSPLPKGFATTFAAISLSTFSVGGSLAALGIISLNANQLIPFAGMIIGNSMNVYTQAVERLKSDAATSVAVIEGKIALGASLKEALSAQTQNAVRAALIPTINSLQTVGIIHIPGVTVGMLLAGAEPIKAVSYQLVVMYMLVAVSLLCATTTALFSYKKLLGATDLPKIG